MTAGPVSLVADPDYGRLKDHLIQSTGLAYYSDKDGDLAGRISRRLEILGLRNCASYLEILHHPAEGERELDALAVELTIGETYFFRHTEQFDALRHVVLPDLIERNQSSRRLRIWSAGCATGAEPYSLAVLLRRDLAARIAGWDVSILGTDVNRSFLARAREGRFEEWDLRGASDEVTRGCFDRHGKSWALRPEYKEWVSFQYHNLAKHPFPSLVHNLAAFDLILCRNVMIYFGPAATASMVDRFWESLVEGGWLLVGHAEPNTEVFRQFRTVSAPGTTLYKKTAEAAGRAAPLESLAWPAPDTAPAALPLTEFERAHGGLPAGHTLASSPALDLPAAPSRAQRAPQLKVGASEQRESARSIRAGALRCPSEPSAEAGALAGVRALADRGDWQGASACCRRLLEADGLNPEIHFYLALALEQLGAPAEAELSLRRALYLDRGLVLAHYHLALFLQKNKNVPQAVRSFENVLELLSRGDDGDLVTGADGMTVAGLKELTEMHLEVLRRADWQGTGGRVTNPQVTDSSMKGVAR